MRAAQPARGAAMPWRELPRLRQLLPGLAICLALTACATARVTPYQPPAPEYALPAAADSAFTAIEADLHARHGAGTSGFHLLDSNEESLRWRLAMIDSARHSIDFQYYLWYGDAAGRLVGKRLLDAADRGVRVRVLVDDLNTLLRDASSVVLRDKAVAWLDSHPNMEVRLFNPWSNRDFAGRVGEGLVEFEKTNKRMHNKSLIVDNRAVIIGGRNIGDEYMGLNPAFNFHDLDVLGIGPVARQASAVFDAYWNSDWVMPAAALDISIPAEASAAARAEILEKMAANPALSRFDLEPRSWADEIGRLPGILHAGTSRVISDLPQGSTIDHVMMDEVRAMLVSTQRELLMVNAYIIPAERGITTLARLHAEGREIGILTNSLASHDVPAVNSHYRPWRKAIVETGAELYELRADAAIQSQVCDTPPTRAEFVGLHSKAMVVDRRWVYVGSMNFDPRSAFLNTEMGVVVDSTGLGEALALLIERDMSAANSWRVTLDTDGKLQWAHDEEVTDVQPARNFWQRVQEFFFRAVPKEYY
jgi:putative cardiolipin synthase